MEKLIWDKNYNTRPQVKPWCQKGALAAARQFNPKAYPPVLGFTYIDDASWTANQRKRFESNQTLREDFLVKTDDEVRSAVFGKISLLRDPVQGNKVNNSWLSHSPSLLWTLVVFKNHYCLDCGATGDVRLMPEYCHMEKVDVHPGSLIQYHPKRPERYHDSLTVLQEHPGGLYRPWYSFDMLICKMGGERYICCGSLSGQPGCRKLRWVHSKYVKSTIHEMCHGFFKTLW